MNKREFFDLSFRVISIFLFLDMLSRTPNFLIYYVDGPVESNAVRKFINVIFFFAIPLTIIWMSRTRSEWFLEQVLGRDHEEEPTLVKATSAGKSAVQETGAKEIESQVTEAQDADAMKTEEEIETIESRGFTAENVQQIAFVILGLWIIATALPDFVHDLALYLSQDSFDTTTEFEELFQPPYTHWSDLIVSGGKSLIGFVLVTSGDNITEIVNRLRMRSLEA